jgi:threonine dehydrogenase-like Zn-dependent dehydrogenase
MNSNAVRLYGKKKLKQESFKLSPLKKGEMYLDVVCNAVCTSCNKIATIGSDHERAPKSLSKNPVILGHEFCATVREVGETLNSKFNIGDSFILQPMIYEKGNEKAAIGHSFGEVGGYATTIKVPESFVEANALVKWNGVGAYKAALAEPLACIIAAWRAQYHTRKESFKPVYGTRPTGKTVLLAGVGAMGRLAAYLWKLKSEKEATLVIYGRNNEKLTAVKNEWIDDSRVTVIETGSDGEEELKNIGGEDGFDDVVLFAPSKELAELGLSLLAYDGCFNLFAGPFEEDFSVPVNLHSVHYKRHHIVGSSGASGEDLRRALKLIETGEIDPSFLVTHIGGLDAVEDTVLNLPQIGGGKKLIYPSISLQLTAISDFNKLAKLDYRFTDVAKEIKNSGGFWSPSAEDKLLEIFKKDYR